MQRPFRRTINRTRAAIDLASIMVGVAIVGVITGAAAATIFGAIPWAQDQSTQTQLSTVASSEAAYINISNAGYGSYQELAGQKILQDDIPGLCVSKNGAGWVAVMKSPTGNLFSMRDGLKTPTPATSADFDSCATTKLNIGTAEAANFQPKIMRFTIDTSYKFQGTTGTVCTAYKLPARGTVNAKVDWGDGSAIQTVTTQNQAHTYSTVGRFNVVIDGTFTSFGGGNITGSAPLNGAGCATEVTHWGRSTGTTDATGAYSNFQGSSGVVQPPPTVTNYSGLFASSRNFNQDISKWDTSQVTKMPNIFYAATAFNQPVGSWSTAQVTDISYAFIGNTVFDQDLSGWDTSKVVSMNNTFVTAVNFTGRGLSRWDTSQVTNMTAMFQGASKFNGDLSTWNTGRVGLMDSMFSNAPVFNSYISGWNTANVTSMGAMFSGAYAFDQPIGSWDTTKLTNVGSMFYGSPVFNQDLSHWKTGAITMFGQMFTNAAKFNQPVNNWDTSSATNMLNMFYGAKAFDQPVSNWNTSQVTTMSGMFQGALKFNQPLNNWDTSKVTTMSFMFALASSFNQDLSTWNVSKVTVYNSFTSSGPLSPAYLPHFV